MADRAAIALRRIPARWLRRRDRSRAQRVGQRRSASAAPQPSHICQFLVRCKVAPGHHRSWGDITVLFTRNDALQPRPGAKSDESRFGQRLETTSRRAGADWTLQPLLRAASHLGHGANRALAHVALRRRTIFSRSTE